ncbi:hypothetical protein RB653_000812 [Dictyostelium firmibasis]|uniref:GDP-fucose pyrophosphorylase domain-containing protein n=1 Tax=Dictyostelium firmibasis TaxID=79012 RepID=A0AAN7UFU1_9MYCE
MMELGFEDDIDLLKQYQSIQSRKTKDYKKYLPITEENKNEYRDLISSFWDVIVITAIDSLQKEYYEQVLKEKMKQKQIPSFIPYVVISDPIGEKIGCGGSTLYVLKTLSTMFGDDKIKNMKILLLHAGGYSKRLPNHSTTGKIFASIPCTLGIDDDNNNNNKENESKLQACSMLEIKLIILIDIPKRMKPGVFLACSDDIELFESNEMSFDSSDDGTFIALSQPGTLDIGVGHGVFILDDVNQYKPNQLNSCRKFIHKPSKEKMKNENAILSNGLVLMDSCYYFDNKVSSILLNYYNENNPINCEIDAYSDFLQPLGKGAEPNYFQVKSNVTKYLEHLPKEREKIYNFLNSSKCKLEMIPMSPSAFIHIGTCHEYIEHFTINFPKLGFKNLIFSEIDSKQQTDNMTNNVILHSILLNNLKININDNSVVEYCNFKGINKLSIGNRCIVSDLEFSDQNQSTSNLISVEIPSNSFIQTLSISGDRYVTIFFGIDDDLKSTLNPKLFGIPLKEYNLILNNSSDGNSLWNAPLFPVSSISPQDSLLKTLNHLKQHQHQHHQQHQQHQQINLNSEKSFYFSIEQCLNEKDLSKQFIRRSNLTNEILNLKNKK